MRISVLVMQQSFAVVSGGWLSDSSNLFRNSYYGILRKTRKHEISVETKEQHAKQSYE